MKHATTLLASFFLMTICATTDHSLGGSDNELGSDDSGTGGANDGTGGAGTGGASDGTGGANPGSGGAPPQGCTLIGCAAGAVFHYSWPFPYESVQSLLSVKLCRNDVCFGGALSQLPAERPAQGVGVGFSTPDGPTIDSTQSPHVEFTVWPEGEHSRIDAQWWPYNLDELQDGDHYVFSAVYDGGQEAVLIDTIAHYETSWPNGPQCGPACMRFETGGTL